MTYSVSSSVVSSVVRGIVNPRSLISYITSSRALDLTSPFTSASTTVADRSPESNDATLYTGRFVSTDGVADIGINADISAAPTIVTGKVRARMVSPTMGIQLGSDGSGYSILEPVESVEQGEWKEYNLTVTSGGVPIQDKILLGRRENAGGNWYAGDWSDLRLYDASGNLVARWQLNESADGNLDGYPALDSVGGYHGTHTGCAGGTGEAGILQTAGMDWNKRMWFDGVNDYVNLGSGDPLGFNGASKIEVKAKIVVWENPASIEDIFYAYINLSSVGFSFDLQTNGTIRASGRSVTSDGYENFTSTTTVNLKSENIIEVYLDYANDEIGIRINGGSYETGAATFANGTYTYGASSLNTRIGNSEGLGRFFTGLIYDVEVYKDDALIDSYEGYGNTDGDWEDQVGSNNGTVNGSPSNYLIPASDATPTNDALGNAIAEPRPTADTWNLFGDGEYGLVADADSLDVTTAATWEIWGNFYGATAANESYLSKTDITNGTRVFQIYRDAVENSDEEITILLGSATGTFGAGEEFDVPDSVCQVCVTFDSGTLKAYVNGSEVTLNNLSGTIPSSLFATTSPVGVGARRNAGTWGSFSKNQISRPKIYNRALTADEVLQNYNAQKGAFGL